MAAMPLFAQKSLNVTVKNTLGFERNEVVAIKYKDLAEVLKGRQEQEIGVKNKSTGKWQTLQWVDYDGDGKNDELLFMAVIKANASTEYIIENADGNKAPESNIVAYSRFVPERTDDYTWENDKVAFRTYGPDAQQRTEQKRENGTLSSGIDIWLKRTPESVINSWYKGYQTDPMYYHKDRGEGYDPYHVGASRGTGGTGVWEKDSLLVSKNFISYKTIAQGPLRTVFELQYAPYSGYDVKETKRISLDLGSNFSKFEVRYKSVNVLPNYAVGITLHDNKGKTVISTNKGIFAHHEAIDGLYVGEGLVFPAGIVEKAFDNKSKTKDQSNLIVLTKPSGEVTYYAGFAWEKGGQAKNAAEWEALLKKQAEIIASPLAVTIK
ncbi:hypothetical protein AM493_06100 [Flavobacterium akiainvivens]|uniref:DUF4861 domain-containing protein n=2 Tax=Flavobacterium akiainvivens TaxID=1202724 RepID=A0A0M8MKT3_9FLAO|nr:hypothetical protein AM493_06100 [Flavobacterium akiainvivens]